MTRSFAIGLALGAILAFGTGLAAGEPPCVEDTDSVTIEGSGGADFGGDPVLLTATFSGLDVGASVTYEWSIDSGPASVFDNGDGTADVECTEVGEVVVRVDASDDTCEGDAPVSATHRLCCETPDGVTIPFRGEKAGPEVVLTANFDGNDAGDAATYTWTVSDGFGAAIDDNGDGTALLTCLENVAVAVRVEVSDGLCADEAFYELSLKCVHGDGRAIPGDCNMDNRVDISDLICIARPLFFDVSARYPCGNGSATHVGNVALLDANGDGMIDLSDAIYQAGFLFGSCARPPCPAPARGAECQLAQGCPDFGCGI